MIKILNITSILPIEEINKKKNENDILLITEREIRKRKENFSIEYLFVFPRATQLLSLFSEKWKSYYYLGKRKRTKAKDKSIYLVPLFMLPTRFWFRKFLFEISYWTKRKYIKDIILTVKPTVIHAHNLESDAFLASKLSKKYNLPYIISLRAVSKKLDSFQKSNIKNARAVIALNPFHKKYFSKKLQNEIHYIPHGIPQMFFDSDKRMSLNLPLKLVVVTRLIPLKNIDKVIKALSFIEEDFVFHIYGVGPEEQKLKTLISELNLTKKIALKGKVEHVKLPRILLNYDLFVMPSYPETLGRVFLEALACGVPIIAGKSTGVDGIITDRKEGFLVDPNVNDLLELLRDIFNAPTQLLLMKAPAIELSKQFSWDIIVEKYGILYKNHSS